MENNFTRNVSFFRFEDLRVYNKALDYADWVATATQDLSQSQTNFIAVRFNTAAQAIAFYIAEGSSRNKNHFVYYLKLAKSSLRECVILTSVLNKQGVFSEQMVELSRNQLIELMKMIAALMSSIQKTIKKTAPVHHNPQEQEEELEFADQPNLRKY